MGEEGRRKHARMRRSSLSVSKPSGSSSAGPARRLGLQHFQSRLEGPELEVSASRDASASRFSSSTCWHLLCPVCGKRSACAHANSSMLSLRAELARASARAARASSTRPGPKPFKKLLAANRGEIATRILRAGTELDLRTVAIYSQEDRYTAHRYKADQAFRVGRGQTPVGAYLDIESIVRIAKHNDVDCVHPGYGLLSERTDFAAALEAEGIAFVGPTVAQLQTFGDKTAARTLATSVGVPLVPGTNHAVTTVAEARAWIEGPGEGGAPPVGYPVIIKAAMGGGGAACASSSAPRTRGGGRGRASSGARRVRRRAPSSSSGARSPRARRRRLARGSRARARASPRPPLPSRFPGAQLREGPAPHRGADPRPTARATSSTCSTATAACSAATRRSSRPRPRSTCRPRRARRCSPTRSA